jgi:O-antigen/teichoic acid export membrane protein
MTVVKKQGLMDKLRRLLLWLNQRGKREFLAFSASLLALQGSRFIVSLLAARDLGAITYGYWNVLALILLYGLYLQLGVLNGMGRDVPYYTGRGEMERIQRIHATSWSVALVSSLIGAGAIMLGSFWFADLRLVLGLLGLTLIAQMLFQYFQFRLRAELLFTTMSWLQGIAAITLPIWYIMLRPLGLAGFVIAQGLAMGVAVLFAARRIGFQPVLRIDLPEMRRLVLVGFPIMAAGILFSLLTTVDRWIILGFLGVEQLGYYTLSILCLSLISLFPQMIIAQMYPRLAKYYGETNSIARLRQPLIRQGIYALLITVPVVLITFLALPAITTYLLPQYAAGVDPARLLLIGMLCLPISGAIGNFLNVIGRQWWFMLTQALGIVLQLCLGLLFVWLGWGLTGIAGAAMLTYTITLVMLLVMARRLFRQQPVG